LVRNPNHCSEKPSGLYLHLKGKAENR